MNTRKLFVILSAVFSCISVLIPFYTVSCDGISNGVEVTGTSFLSLVKTFSGIAILVSAAAIIISVIFIKKKIGYAAVTIYVIVFFIVKPNQPRNFTKVSQTKAIQ